VRKVSILPPARRRRHAGKNKPGPITGAAIHSLIAEHSGSPPTPAAAANIRPWPRRCWPSRPAGISVNNAAAAITEPFGQLTEAELGLSFGST